MENLKLDAPTIIEVVGLPGAGKSFFATQFAHTFSAAIVSFDHIRWTLFAHHTYSDNENAMVEQVADLLITELLKTRKTFVLDGGCNTRPEREEIAKRARKAGFQVVTVVVQVDDATAKRRALKRSANNPGDRYKQSMTASDFAAQEKNFQMPVVEKTTVVISGKHTYTTQARMVLKKILEIQNAPVAVRNAPRPVPILHGRSPFIQ